MDRALFRVKKNKSAGEINTKLCILFLILAPALFSSLLVSSTSAQSETAYDLIAAVNDLRASQGLEPYQIDPWLMNYAQEHSEYQASIQTGTHLHSDGLLPQDHGLQENVAGGDEGVVTVNVVVYEIWVDWGHRHTLVGYSTGFIGAGVALSDNGQVYYTIDIRPGENSVTVTPVLGTPLSYVPLETNIPRENGSIVHIVGYGQTLWNIALAYGVTIDDICRLNGIADNSSIIYAGQNLLIHPAYTVTPTLSGETLALSTLPMIDSTPLFTTTPLSTATAMPSLTSTPTSIPLTPSTMPTVLPWNRVVSLIVLLTIGVIGVLAVIIFSFKKS